MRRIDAIATRDKVPIAFIAGYFSSGWFRREAGVSDDRSSSGPLVQPKNRLAVRYLSKTSARVNETYQRCP